MGRGWFESRSWPLAFSSMSVYLHFSQLRETIEQEIHDMGLQSTLFTLTKVIQLYETKNSRHSTMIVGCTGSGKTTSWRVLQSSLSNLCRAGEPNFNIVRVLSWDSEAPGGGQLGGQTVVAGWGYWGCGDQGRSVVQEGRAGSREGFLGQMGDPRANGDGGGGSRRRPWPWCLPAAQRTPHPLVPLGVPSEPKGAVPRGVVWGI